jgi:hypothetical protein
MANKYTDAVHKLILPGKGRDRVTTKAVLTAMAWHTDNKSGVFWGSYSLFAHEANCSRDAVRESIQKLIELGLLTITGEKPTRFGPCHMFKMNYDVIVKYSDQVAEVPSGSPTGLEDDQAGEEPSGSNTHYQVAEPQHQGVEPSDQVALPLKNSSLNSSLNSSFNSSSHDKPYASLRPLRGDHSMEAPSVRPGEPGPFSTNFLSQLEEEDSQPAPVHTTPPAPVREAVRPAPAQIVKRTNGHRFAQTYNGLKCLACKTGWSQYEDKGRKPCPNEEMEIEAVDAPKEPKAKPEIEQITNPVRTHDWTKNRDVCCVCQASRDEARYEGIACETAEGTGA